MSKYEPLYKYLTDLPLSIKEKTLTFEEVTDVLGFDLPKSAYDYREWWSNPSSSSDHPYAQMWLSAGWKVDTVNQDDCWVRFKRLR